MGYWIMGPCNRIRATWHLRGGTQMAAAPGVLRFDDPIENKQGEGRSEGSLGLYSRWLLNLEKRGRL